MRFADLDARFFQGAIPQMIATCSATFEPNITYLSHILRVDDNHVALSCQFFNKCKRNVLENPQAALILYDPINFDCYRLELAYQRAELSGHVFDMMNTRIEAIASHSGMTGIFKLLSADIYEVLECRKLDGFMMAPPPGETYSTDPLIEHRSELRALQLISAAPAEQRISRSYWSTSWQHWMTPLVFVIPWFWFPIRQERNSRRSPATATANSKSGQRSPWVKA